MIFYYGRWNTTYNRGSIVTLFIYFDNNLFLTPNENKLGPGYYVGVEK